MRLSILFLLCAPLLVYAQTARPGITAEDYFALKNVTDAQLSPDGKSVAYVVTSVDEKRNRRDSAIWLIPADASAQAVRLTAAGSARNPRWSPDGRTLAFLAVRPAPTTGSLHADKTQVQLLAMSGGEPRRLTDLPDGVDSFQWSPAGDRLVVVSRTGPARKPAD